MHPAIVPDGSTGKSERFNAGKNSGNFQAETGFEPVPDWPGAQKCSCYNR
jgi:hypothetical protein